MRDNWTDKLPSLMEGYQEAPPEGLWDAVQAGATRPKRVVLWPWVAGLAAAAAVVLAVFLWRPAPEAIIVADTPVADRLADVPVEVAVEAPVEEVPVVEAPARVQITPKTHPEAQNTASQVQITPEVHLEEPETEPQVQTEPETHPKQEQKSSEEPVQWIEPAPRKKPFRGRITVSSGTALLAQATTGVSQGYGIPSNPGMGILASPDVKSEINARMLSRNRASTTEESHRQTLRLSIGLNYEFAPRWSVGTGLSYSALQSRYVTTSGTTTTETTRYVSYLGVPVLVQYQLLEWWRLSLYVNAGPMVESAIGCYSRTDSYLGSRKESSHSEELPCTDWRWSLNAGAGLQVRVFRGGAFYVQPGLSWHIPGPAAVESFYTTRPLAFSVDFGYRWYLR